jgi:hypothetical protein
MTFTDAKKRARELTMGCWWPSRAYPMRSPVWPEVLNELRMSAEQAIAHRGDFREADEIYLVMQALDRDHRVALAVLRSRR